MMIANPSQTGVFTVSLNPPIATHANSQSSLSMVPSLQSTLILPPPVQQVSQPNMQQIVTGGQIVNLTPVRAPEPTNNNTTPTSKTQNCTFCNKKFSSRFNASRHEKICKLNTPSSTSSVQQLVVAPPVDNKEYQCMFCQVIFSAQDSLTRHVKKCKNANAVAITNRNIVNVPQHSHGRRVHICKFCAKEFSTKWNAIRHERLFHNPNDPIVVPQSVANGMVSTVVSSIPPGKPERYCRFCGNYFSSKYNAIRHEKICTRVQENASSNQDQNTQQQQQQQQQQPTQQQQITPQKTVQITTITDNASGQAQPAPQQMIIQQTQQPTQQQQQHPQIQQQIVQQQRNIQQVQQSNQLQTSNIQNPQQQQQLMPQQTMLLIEQPTTPFHVCKFCNKQLSTRCDPVGHNLLPTMPTVATITGQPMQIGSSGTQLTGLMTPVMASLPQVTLVQPPIQGQQLIQQQTQLQQNKQRMQQGTNHQQPQSNPPVQQQQQVNLQQIRIPEEQHGPVPTQVQSAPQHHQQLQVTHVQQLHTVSQPVDRPHNCKFCDKHFATKWYLEQHEKIHTGEADMCKDCGKFFVTRWHLDKHMRVHTQGGPSAKKFKKESMSPATSTVMSADNTLPSQVTFSAQGVRSTRDAPMIGTQHSTTAGNKSQDSFELSATREGNSYFIPSLEQNTSQNVSVSSAAPRTSTHVEEHSTIDETQIASSLSIPYSLS